MSVLFARLEVVESRIASFSCPRGTTGRVHSLRLRRCIHSNGRRPQWVSQANYQPLIDGGDPTPEVYIQNGNGLEYPRSLVSEEAGKRQDRSLGSEAIQATSHGRRIDTWYQRYDTNGDIAKRQKLQHLDGLGDVMSFQDSGTDTVPGTGPLYSALRLGNPHLVLKALANITKYDTEAHTTNMLVSIAPSTFSEILRCLDPAHFVGRLTTLHNEIGPRTANHLRLPQNEDGYLRFCKIFLDQIDKVLEARAQHYSLSTSDMKYLLKCARAVGSTKSAQAIWRSMTSISQNNPDKKIIPDGECYNHYLATKCWGDTFNPDRRYKVRVIPSHLQPRTWSDPPHRFRGHRVGPVGGIKAEASEIFRQMIESGIPGNEETFCQMMVALAREGDVSGISNILQRVWDIDVDLVLTKDDSEVPHPRPYASHSPFYPSEQLLFTLAYVYGINNAIPNALRLVDYISRQYKVSIPVGVWKELLQWTYVTSVRRTGQNPETNNADLKTGQLHPGAVSSLWTTMTSEPYSVEPTMEMYNYFITNLLRRGRFGEAKIRIEEAYRANHQYIGQLSDAVTAYRASLARSAVQAQHARDVYMARLRVRRNRLYIRRWVKRWVRSGSSRMRFNETFCTQDLPNFLKQWERFLPVRVHYAVASGDVVFATGVKEANFKMQLRYADNANAPNLLSSRLILPSHVRKYRNTLGHPVFKPRRRMTREVV